MTGKSDAETPQTESHHRLESLDEDRLLILRGNSAFKGTKQ